MERNNLKNHDNHIISYEILECYFFAITEIRKEPIQQAGPTKMRSSKTRRNRMQMRPTTVDRKKHAMARSPPCGTSFFRAIT